MPTRSIRTRRAAAPFLAALVLLLGACGAPAAPAPTAEPTSAPTATAEPTSTPAPTSEPTSTPAPTSEPTSAAAPTSAPAGAAVLPAPLYFLNEQQQVVRLDADGQTVTPITSEKQPISQFSASPADGALLYIVGDRASQTLVQVDAQGGNRAELLSGTLESPVWMPNGQGYAVAWSEGPEGPGVYRARGGNREVVRLAANVPFQQDGAKTGVRYTPVAWSPDGSQLLLNAIPDFGPDAPGGDIGVVGRSVATAAGPIVDLVRSGGDPYMCLDASWSSDGAQIYCANYGASGGTPGLWRLPAAGGQPKLLITSSAAGEQTDVFNAREIGGEIYAFVGAFSAGTTSPTYEMQRLAAGGGGPTTLRRDEYDTNAVIWSVWAPDGSGAVVQAAESGQTTNALIWTPADGGEAVALGARIQGQPQWGAARP